MQGVHTPGDPEIFLIDCIPHPYDIEESLWHAIRTRMEEIWINKLQASINIKRQTRNSFTGYGASRNASYLDD